MSRIENHCCNCAAPGYPCRGSLCPNRRVEVDDLDGCDEELEDVDEEVVMEMARLAEANLNLIEIRRNKIC